MRLLGSGDPANTKTRKQHAALKARVFSGDGYADVIAQPLELNDRNLEERHLKLPTNQGAKTWPLLNELPTRGMHANKTRNKGQKNAKRTKIQTNKYIACRRDRHNLHHDQGKNRIIFGILEHTVTVPLYIQTFRSFFLTDKKTNNQTHGSTTPHNRNQIHLK